MIQSAMMIYIPAADAVEQSLAPPILAFGCRLHRDPDNKKMQDDVDKLDGVWWYHDVVVC
jgi:hypothetical protein